MDGWIKLHRKMLEWEWYNDNNTKIVFLHLLLTVNHKEKMWQGISIKRGQKITSIKHLAEETNLTVRQIRTALDKLKSTNEITIKTTNKYSLVTIEKYSNYQSTENENDKQDDKQKNNQTTTNKNEKNILYYILFNKYKKRIEENPKKSISIIIEAKHDKDYESLTLEEQNQLFYDLTDPSKRSDEYGYKSSMEKL